MATNQSTSLSAFADTTVYNIDGLAMYGLRQQRIIADSTDTFTALSQRYVDRWDLLAYDLYGDARLWWVIPEVNAVIDPSLGPSLGQTVRIPTRTRVLGTVK